MSERKVVVGKTPEGYETRTVNGKTYTLYASRAWFCMFYPMQHDPARCSHCGGRERSLMHRFSAWASSDEAEVKP